MRDGSEVAGWVVVLLVVALSSVFAAAVIVWTTGIAT